MNIQETSLHKSFIRRAKERMEGVQAAERYLKCPYSCRMTAYDVAVEMETRELGWWEAWAEIWDRNYADVWNAWEGK